MKALLLLALAGCDWSLHRMQEQPKCTTFASTPLLAGWTCSLTPPQGTIAWQDEGEARPPRSRGLIERGEDRFERFCAACHGQLGDGDSDVARAMALRKPPTLLDATAAALDDDRIFTVITNGYGMMPSYASSLPPADRWAVIELVRVLQHREIAIDQLTAGELKEALSWLR